MTDHPFFGIQASETVSNPPAMKQISVSYRPGPNGTNQLNLVHAKMTPQHQFATLEEAEDFYIAEVLKGAPRATVDQLNGALGIVIQRMGNKIAMESRRGMGNVVVINNDYLPQFIEDCNSVVGAFHQTGGRTVGRHKHVGDITGMHVWTSPLVPKDSVVVLYKSNSPVTGDVDVAAAACVNGFGCWLSLLNNHLDYVGVIQL